MAYTKGNILCSWGVFLQHLSESHVRGFGVQKGVPGFEGDSLSTFQGARCGEDSPCIPRNLMIPASSLMGGPAHLALGLRGEDLFMSGRPGVRDSLLWPVIHSWIHLFLPDSLSFWSHPLSSMSSLIIFPMAPSSSIAPSPLQLCYSSFWEPFPNYSPIPWNHSLGCLSWSPYHNLPNTI